MPEQTKPLNHQDIARVMLELKELGLLRRRMMDKIRPWNPKPIEDRKTAPVPRCYEKCCNTDKAWLFCRTGAALLLRCERRVSQPICLPSRWSAFFWPNTRHPTIQLLPKPACPRNTLASFQNDFCPVTWHPQRSPETPASTVAVVHS